MTRKACFSFFSPLFVFTPKHFCAGRRIIHPGTRAVVRAMQNDNDNNTTNQIALPAMYTQY